VPALSLIPLGSIWLWQQGWLLYWAIAACATTAVAFGVQRWLLPPEEAIAAATDEATAGADPKYTPLESQAWREVRRVASATQPESLYSQDAALSVAVDVVERVARVMRPGAAEPVWHFTAPEVLALIEQVSRRLRIFIDGSVPLADRLTIAQALQLWRWRGVIDTAQSAYDIWRLVRLLNPVSAITHELRERLSHQIYEWGKGHVAKRLAEAYVEEVGRAAIDLYGGRLRAVVALEEMPLANPAEAGAAEQPLRIFVGGQPTAGKSRLVNALATAADAAVDTIPTTSAFRAYAITRDELAGALVIDSPGLGISPEQRRQAVDMATGSDLVIWVVAAHRADREPDRAALADLRAHFAERPDRRPPPVLLVLTHIDQLRPWGEWRPPYDLVERKSPKARAIHDAMTVVAGDLSVPVGDVVPVCLEPTVGLYNVDMLIDRMVALAPEARQTRLVRLLRLGRNKGQWRRLWSQAANAGRVVAGQIIRRRKA
jgi:uncharacterized protein